MALTIAGTTIELKLCNTLTREKEPLKTVQPGHVNMYTCGPTVYNFAHIGNFRTYVFEDLLRRTIQFFGYKINHVMNITDVDDKTIRGAIAKNSTLREFTDPYTTAFFEDLKTLHIQPAEHYPAATEYIPQMITMIQQLLDKGVAYKGSDGSVYFAIKKFPKYGCLSHFHLDELEEGASDRIANDEYEKESAADFVLWKGYEPERDGKIFWESPYGPGRPGWHLECSVMAMNLLGDTLDIHVGGVDNMFPHHENEIAQSESCSGKVFSNYWLHVEHLIVDNKKMSKSLGNFYTIRDLLQKGFSGTQIRYLLISTHYKTPLNFTFAGLDAAKNALSRIQDFILRIQELAATSTSVDADAVLPLIERCHLAFAEALGDDFNISQALASLFDFIRQANALADTKQISKHDAEAVLEFLHRVNDVIGVMEFSQQDDIPTELQHALEQRIQARKDKNWALADQLRDLISSRGYVIEDTASGARLKKV
jgi:cysteinyl-tRNA synthetase